MTFQTQTTYKTIPGPRGLPILGVMPEMVSDMLELFTKTAHEYGGIAQFKLLNSTYFLTSRFLSKVRDEKLMIDNFFDFSLKF